jgi:hypothetical protein
MSYRRRHRWFRRVALGLAFASVMFAGRASVAAAKTDPGPGGSRYVVAGGWSGQVDPQSGIPITAGIPEGDEQFIGSKAVQVVPYLSHGLLTQEQADAAAAQAIHDPYLTDIFVRPGESLSGPDGDAIAFANGLVAAADSLHDPIGAGEQQTTFAAAEAVRDRYPSVNSSRPDGDLIAIGNAIEAQTLAAAEALRTPYNSPGVFGEAVKTANVADVKFAPGVTDFPTTPQTAPDNRVERALKQGPQVIPYLSQGMTSDDVVGARPDDRADRFAHSDVSPRPQMATASGSTINWDNALMAAIGGLVLVLGLGLALGYLRRPRLAGL